MIDGLIAWSLIEFRTSKLSNNYANSKATVIDKQADNYNRRNFCARNSIHIHSMQLKFNRSL